MNTIKSKAIKDQQLANSKLSKVMFSAIALAVMLGITGCDGDDGKDGAMGAQGAAGQDGTNGVDDRKWR
ncbi:hypothetical protein [Pseudoalteromonas sp. GB43]